MKIPQHATKFVFGLIILSLFVLPIFQNCSRFSGMQSQISNESGSSSAGEMTGGVGNGGGYGGGITPTSMYFRFRSRISCPAADIGAQALVIAEQVIITQQSITHTNYCTGTNRSLTPNDIHNLDIEGSFISVGTEPTIFELFSGIPDTASPTFRSTEVQCYTEPYTSLGVLGSKLKVFYNGNINRTFELAYISLLSDSKQFNVVRGDAKSAVAVGNRYFSDLSQIPSKFELNIDILASLPGQVGLYKSNLRNILMEPATQERPSAICILNSYE